MRGYVSEINPNQPIDHEKEDGDGGQDPSEPSRSPDIVREGRALLEGKDELLSKTSEWME